MSSNLSFSPLILCAQKDKKLAQAVASKLNWPLSTWNKNTFANSETIVYLPQSVRKKQVYVFFSNTSPINESFFELFIAIDAISNASPESLTLVIPFLAYGRQERKESSRDPVSTALIARLLKAAGVHKILTVDPHSPSSLGFYQIPFEALSFQKNLLLHLFQTKITNYVLASPDLQAQKKSQRIAALINSECVVFEKIRIGPNKIEMKLLSGSPAEKNVILLDDMIDTGTTIIQAMQFLKAQGALKIYVLATHGLFSQNALTKMAKLHHDGILEALYISDSYPSPEWEKFSFLKVISLADLFCLALHSDVTGQSLSEELKKTYSQLLRLTKNS